MRRPPTAPIAGGPGGLIVPEQVALQALEAGCRAAATTLAGPGDDEAAVDSALARLREVCGVEVLASVYVREHDRLWLVAQQGYEQVRDGFRLNQGIMARAVASGELQYVADVRADPDFIAATDDIQSEVAVPLGSARPALGVFNVETRKSVLPPEAAGALAKLAPALEARALNRNLWIDLSTLSRLLVYASSLRGIAPVSELATRSIGRLLGVECVQLTLRSGGGFGETASFWRQPQSAAEPLEAVLLNRLGRSLGATSATYSLVDGRTVDLTGVPGEAPWLVWLPLSLAGAELGALVGRSAERVTFGRKQGEAAALLVAHTAALLDVALALEREREAAVSDALTGLLNRRGFDQCLDEAFRRTALAQSPLSLIVLDCDGLKAINERGGHELGDTALQAIGRILASVKRLGDVAARLSGDEFALVLPGSDAEGAKAVAERLRRSLRVETLAGAAVTASFGIATSPENGSTPTQLLRAADEAMFAAKRRGRNRAVSSERPGEVEPPSQPVLR